MLKAIVFDIGNVLLSFDFEKTFRRVAPLCGVAASEIAPRLSQLKGPLESGQISSSLFLEKVVQELQYRGEMADLRQAWQEIFEPIEQTHDLVRRLHGRVPLYLLSNTSDLHTEYFIPRYSVFEHFEDGVFSHEVGFSKPDPAIYHAAIGKFAIEPHATLFVDDLPENIAAAAALGFQTHHYSSQQHEDLERTLEAAGFPKI
jgi:putative hydrolase of the HAD superfamily